MQCSIETIVWLFYNASSSFHLLFIFFYLSSIVLSRIFLFLGGNPFLQRTQEGCDELGLFSEEEEEEINYNGYFDEGYTERDDHDLVADITQDDKRLSFLPTRSPKVEQTFFEQVISSHQTMFEEQDGASDEEQSSCYGTPASKSENGKEEEADQEHILTGNTDSLYNSDTSNGANGATSPMNMDLNKSGLVTDDETHQENFCSEEIENVKVESNFTKDENFLIFAPPKMETRKIQVEERDDEEVFGDSCTVGSTSKSSSEWRSSINNRDSGTEDPFSSSSRRSCPKWESYTVFQKYDEEMLFLDRISAQKLHETESLKSIQACPRSISERIVHKLVTKNKNSSDFQRNPYHELEAAYVAQICLTWEALNWNYKYFQRLRASRREPDPGCPAHIAQQFQQFQVLLQRYIENEPYEHGRRPEIYARMRRLAPKLLQVPEYRDSDNEQKEEGFHSRIASGSFLLIMEEAIRTFMNFLRADRENQCQLLAAFFKRNRRGSVDPTLLLLLKKVNKKKKLKVKDLYRARKCLRKRKLKEEEEIEILMALIDLKVVYRVLRMRDLGEEQLHWCENKMGKVRVCDGKLQRDSSPLFFPAH